MVGGISDTGVVPVSSRIRHDRPFHGLYRIWYEEHTQRERGHHIRIDIDSVAVRWKHIRCVCRMGHADHGPNVCDNKVRFQCPLAVHLRRHVLGHGKGGQQLHQDEEDQPQFHDRYHRGHRTGIPDTGYLGCPVLIPWFRSRGEHLYNLRIGDRYRVRGHRIHPAVQFLQIFQY